MFFIVIIIKAFIKGYLLLSTIMDGRSKLQQWLNQTLRVEITDGRLLIGVFSCTDKDANIILSQCDEFLPAGYPQEPRKLGLAMIPGQHIKKLEVMSHQDGEIL
ncbi:hypothetical protein EB796_008865 [Bugula neritina]|uniref:Sm domain-containing protein n=1 Tax=Bugula neritina TaxID=10212 RepID=A0A7J7K2F0_BUGNE|nr:hypothetical protein EB796_008865 [Bugula neritina]